MFLGLRSAIVFHFMDKYYNSSIVKQEWHCRDHFITNKRKQACSPNIQHKSLCKLFKHFKVKTGFCYIHFQININPLSHPAVSSHLIDFFHSTYSEPSSWMKISNKFLPYSDDEQIPLQSHQWPGRDTSS